MYYAGNGDILTLAISQVGDTPVGCVGGSFMVYPGTLSTTGSNYRLTMPDDTVLITLAPVDFADVNTGTEADPYIIHNAEQWNLLASNVGIGTSFIMPASTSILSYVQVDAAIDADMAAGSWHAVSTPVHDINNNRELFVQVVGMIPADDEFVYDLYRYNEPTATWQNQKAHGDFDHLVLGNGYIYRRSDAATLHFRGVPNEEDVSITLTATDAMGDLAGFNLVGNPFPFKVFVDRAFYVLNADGSWQAHPNGDSIAVGQAILVHTDNPDGETLTFHFATRTTNAGAKGSLPSLPRGLQLADPSDSSTSSSHRPFAHLDGGTWVVEGSGLLQAFDLMGRLLFNIEIQNSKFEIHNSQFPSAGIYILRLNGESQKIVVRAQ